MNASPEHVRYLEQLGIAGRPLSSSIADRANVSAPRQRRPTGRPKKALGVFSESDLYSLRGQIFWRFHTDEEREGFTVLLKRGGRVCGRIHCGSEALAWDAERLCAGIRFKRGAE